MPFSLWASDTGAAMLYVKGTAWLNGSLVPDSSAIFPGDMIQTKPAAAANIVAIGTSIVIGSGSLVQFQPERLELQDGQVQVDTSHGVLVHADDIAIAPAEPVDTQYEVRETDGEVWIFARKGAITVTDSSGTVVLDEGQQTTRGKKKKKRKGGAWIMGDKGLLSSRWAQGAGIAAAGGVILFSLLPNDDPVSPWQP